MLPFFHFGLLLGLNRQSIAYSNGRKFTFHLKHNMGAPLVSVQWINVLMKLIELNTSSTVLGLLTWCKLFFINIFREL